MSLLNVQERKRSSVLPANSFSCCVHDHAVSTAFVQNWGMLVEGGIDSTVFLLQVFNNTQLINFLYPSVYSKKSFLLPYKNSIFWKATRFLASGEKSTVFIHDENFINWELATPKYVVALHFFSFSSSFSPLHTCSSFGILK